MSKPWQPVIGLEVHAQLNTRTKIFSASSTEFGAPPNSQASAIDLGLPGVLPVLNRAAVEKALRFGLAIEAEIGQYSVFARKNYFYPDLPKGYQISQYELPIVGRGQITIEFGDGQQKTIGISRAHLEEDAGKSLHENFANQSGIDLNRAGTPLLEIVSEPELLSIEEAVAYAKKLHTLVQYLEICDGNMQEGSFRIDANISLHQPGQPFGTRAEIKNINSFRFLEKALEYEIERQSYLLDDNQVVIQETRLYDAQKNETRSMRSKEEANDYRYFPDPDLLPVCINDKQIQDIKQNMPELPDALAKRLQREYAIGDYEAKIITADKQLAIFFEQLCQQVGSHYKLCANWLMGDFLGYLNKHSLYLHQSPVSVESFAALLKRIVDQTISGKIAKEIFDSLWQQGGSVDAIIEQKGLRQISDDTSIEAIIDEVLRNNPEQLEEYRQGKHKLLGFFVGQAMKASKGKINPAKLNQLLTAKLNAR